MKLWYAHGKYVKTCWTKNRLWWC